MKHNLKYKTNIICNIETYYRYLFKKHNVGLNFYELKTLVHIIKFLEKTNENDWCIDVVRNKNANCLFGHVMNFFGVGGDDSIESEWRFFSGAYSNSYVVYHINDGKNQKYQQKSPKLRCIQYLRDILSGKEETTSQGMERYSREYGNN
jgi:hypothetical protein